MILSWRVNWIWWSEIGGCSHLHRQICIFFKIIYLCDIYVCVNVRKLLSHVQLCRLQCPWDPPGKNTGAGGPFLLWGSSQYRDWTQISRIAGKFFTVKNDQGSPYIYAHVYEIKEFIFNEASLTWISDAFWGKDVFLIILGITFIYIFYFNLFIYFRNYIYI